MLFVGLDLAWGDRNPDGVAVLRLRGRQPEWVAGTRLHGDEALFQWIRQHVPATAEVLVMLDAPVVCPNRTGSRPVDRETHRLFGRFHAGCHPANATRCPRPLRVAQRFVDEGVAIGCDLAGPAPVRRLIEVYPHVALVRWLGLDRILKYKKGPVASRRREFRRLQSLLGTWLHRHAPGLPVHPQVRELLGSPWTKAAEDQIDALIAALVGWWHGHAQGRQTEVLGDLASGFLLVPREDSNRRAGRWGGHRSPITDY